MSYNCSQSNVIERFNKIHNDKYLYDNVNYIRTDEKVEIICKIHGSFYQTPKNHLVGKGCAKCSRFKKMDENDFIKKALLIHNNKYEYKNGMNLTEGNKSYIDIICKFHGPFRQRVDKHLTGQGCRRCTHTVSKCENELFEELQKHFNDIKQSDKKMLNGKELDIVRYATRRAIEFNGDYWHCNPKIYNKDFINERNRMTAENIWIKDAEKIRLANSNDISVMTVWHSDWINERNLKLNECIQFLGGF